MGTSKKYICDICHKEIKDGHQQYYMVTLITDHLIQVDDGSCAGAERSITKYYVHNDFSNSCMSKIWKLFKK